MQLERTDSAEYQITLHAYELAALISAARWIVEGAEGELTPEAKKQLSLIVDKYDSETERINGQENNPD